MLIIGCGIAGSTAALMLARKGKGHHDLQEPGYHPDEYLLRPGRYAMMQQENEPADSFVNDIIRAGMRIHNYRDMPSSRWSGNRRDGSAIF